MGQRRKNREEEPSEGEVSKDCGSGRRLEFKGAQDGRVYHYGQKDLTQTSKYKNKY